MVAILEMNYCASCGGALEFRQPDDGDRWRHICRVCHTIHYLNPKMVVGALPVWQDQILLCRRAIEPKYGLWTLPGGFMENGETLEQAAARETLEEANARVEIEALYTVSSLAYINQVHFFYRSRLLDLDFGAGPESLEVKLFAEHEIPWDEIAFRPVRFTLQHYFAERKTQNFLCHTTQFEPPVSR